LNINTLQAIRDNALRQLGYFGGYRRSEIVNLHVKHVAWETEGIVITLPRSKMDQRGEGIVSDPLWRRSVLPNCGIARLARSRQN
jgi:integrase